MFKQSILLFFCSITSFAQTIIIDSQTKHPVSYATISLGTDKGFLQTMKACLFLQRKYIQTLIPFLFPH